MLGVTEGEFVPLTCLMVFQSRTDVEFADAVLHMFLSISTSAEVKTLVNITNKYTLMFPFQVAGSLTLLGVHQSLCLSLQRDDLPHNSTMSQVCYMLVLHVGVVSSILGTLVGSDKQQSQAKLDTSMAFVASTCNNIDANTWTRFPKLWAGFCWSSP